MPSWFGVGAWPAKVEGIAKLLESLTQLVSITPRRVERRTQGSAAPLLDTDRQASEACDPCSSLHCQETRSVNFQQQSKIGVELCRQSKRLQNQDMHLRCCFARSAKPSDYQESEHKSLIFHHLKPPTCPGTRTQARTRTHTHTHTNAHVYIQIQNTNRKTDRQAGRQTDSKTDRAKETWRRKLVRKVSRRPLCNGSVYAATYARESGNKLLP